MAILAYDKDRSVQLAVQEFNRQLAEEGPAGKVNRLDAGGPNPICEAKPKP